MASENRKAIIISTGMDNIQLFAALKENESAVGGSLQRVQGLYEKYSGQQAALESRKNAESLAKLKANDDAKLAEMERFFAAQKSMYEESAAVSAVGQGSVPIGMVGVAGGAGAVAKDAAEAEKGIGSLRRFGRELKELGRVLGDITGIGIVTQILKVLGVTIASFISAIPVIGAGAAAYFGIKSQAAKMNAAIGISDASSTSVEKDAARLQERLNAITKSLAERGMLNGAQGTEISRRVSAGGLDNLIFAQHLLQSMFPGGVPMDGAMDDRISEAGRGAARVGMNPRQRWLDSTNQLMRTMTAMNALDKNSTQSKEEQLKYEQLLKQQAEDNLAIQKENDARQKKADEDKKKAQEEEKRRQTELQDLERQRQQLTLREQGELQKQNMEFPTLQELARARVWGGYRTGWQRTDQGEIAHRILTLQQDQLHQREWGNISGANWDAGQIGLLKNTLAAGGFMAQDTRLDAIHSELQNLNTRIAGLQSGKTLAVTIADVSSE